MAIEIVPKTCDWVTRRAECSVEKLFLLLVEVVESDVKVMHARSLPHGPSFTTNKPTSGKLVVMKMFPDSTIAGNVVFERTIGGIEVRMLKRARDEQALFTAKPSLSAEGECRLEIDYLPMELWQVSRRALEDLFFRYDLSTTT